MTSKTITKAGYNHSARLFDMGNNRYEIGIYCEYSGNEAAYHQIEAASKKEASRWAREALEDWQ